MVCGVIDECRCYAYTHEFEPRKKQFCGVRRGPHVSECLSECCAGGCPGQTKGVEPREPFRIVKRHFKEGMYDRMSFTDKLLKMDNSFFERFNEKEVLLVVFVIVFVLMLYLT